MRGYSQIKEDKISRIDKEIEELRDMLDTSTALVHLADQPGWRKFAEKLDKMMRSKIDTILLMEIDERGIDYIHTKKSELGAEVKLLKQILVAPDKHAEEAPRIKAAIERLEAEKVGLEHAVGTRKE